MKLMIVDAKQISMENRVREDLGDINSLIKSFKESGIIQPLAVASTAMGKYSLLAGGRRLTAAIEAGITDIPVRIYEEDLSDLEIKSIELAENIYRKDLAWQEEVKLKEQIWQLQKSLHGVRTVRDKDAPGTSKRQVAEMLNVSSGGFTEDLELATIMSKVPQLAKQRTKSDAMKLLKKLKGKVVDDERAKVIRSQKVKTTTDTQRKSLVERFIINDFFEGVKKVENETIDLIEIDPPYGIDLKGKKKHKGATNVGTLDYNEIDSFRYEKFIVDVLKESYRVLKANSWIILWFGHEPWFETMFKSLEKAGFIGNRLAGIWNKGVGQTMQPDYYMANAYEMFFYARKGSPVLHRKGRSNVFEYPPIPSARKIHPTERPLDMMEDLLDTFVGPGSTVMVPFLGSGNTLLACENKDMQSFGFELSEDYKNKFTIRVYEQVPGTFRI